MGDNVHVAFGASAAGSLKRALAASARLEEVLCLQDDLSYGPINPAEPTMRLQWAVEELGFEDEPRFAKLDEEFWSRVTSIDAPLVVWISRRCVSEYCGLLELLWRVERPMRVVDIADLEFVGSDGTPNPIRSTAFAYVSEQEIAARNLLDWAVDISAAQRDAYRREWQRLRDENAPLRVITDRGALSARLDHFDAALVSCVTTEWQTCARVIGDALPKISTDRFRQCSSDALLFERLLRLVDAGTLEASNEGHELWSIRWSRVRRAVTSRA